MQNKGEICRTEEISDIRHHISASRGTRQSTTRARDSTAQHRRAHTSANPSTALSLCTRHPPPPSPPPLPLHKPQPLHSPSPGRHTSQLRARVGVPLCAPPEVRWGVSGLIACFSSTGRGMVVCVYVPGRLEWRSCAAASGYMRDVRIRVRRGGIGGAYEAGVYI